MDNKMFWVVWALHGGAPTHLHYSQKDAEVEAERLARKHRGTKFVVLQAVAAHVTSDVQRIEYEEELPF